MEKSIKKHDEYVVRNMLTHLISTRKDLVEYYFRMEDFDEEKAGIMLYLLENDLSIPLEPTVHNRLDEIPDNIIQDLCDYINNINTRNGKGLLHPKITLKDLKLLLTSGNCEDNHSYSCKNIAKLSYILQYLAGKNVLNKHNYQSVICSHDKLMTFDRKSPDGCEHSSPITPKYLSKSAWQAKENSEAYMVIRSKITKIFGDF